jgi:hypothetical protein
MSYIHSIVPAPVPRKPDDGTAHVGYSYSQVSHFTLFLTFFHGGLLTLLIHLGPGAIAS